MTTTSEAKKLKICCPIFSLIYALEILFVCLRLFSLENFSKLKMDSNPLIGIKSNLQAPFVTLVTKRIQTEVISSLNQTETQSGAFVQLWPGTNSGCDCLKVTDCDLDWVRTEKLIYDPDGCNLNSTKCGCTSVEGTEPTNFTKLGGSEFDKLTSKKISFASIYEKITINNTCPVGYKICQRFKSSDYSYCVPGTQCPLTDLRIS